MAELNAINVFGDNLTIKQLFFDASHPIGSTYTQYPQQDSPQTLFNNAGVTSTWEVVNYDGAFFRAQGTNANDFIEKTGVLSKQSDLVKSHSHNFTPSGSVSSHSHGLNGHTHSFTPSGYIASTIGGTDNKTTGMSGNSTGSITFQKDRSVIPDDTYISGMLSVGEKGAHCCEWSDKDDWVKTININIAHTHTAYFTGTEGTTNGNSEDTTSVQPSFTGYAGTTSSNDSNAIENRPVNYTIRVWKRTA